MLLIEWQRHLGNFRSSTRDFIVNGSILTKPHFANSHFKSKFGQDGGLVQVQLGSKYQLAIECGLKFGDFEKIQQQASNYCITGGFQSSSFTLSNWLNSIFETGSMLFETGSMLSETGNISFKYRSKILKPIKVKNYLNFGASICQNGKKFRANLISIMIQILR